MNGEPETARGRATPSPGRLIENKHPIRDAHAHPTRRRRHRGKFALPRSKNVRRPNRKRATSPQRKTDLAPMAADNHQASRATERRSLNTKILAAPGRAEDPSARWCWVLVCGGYHIRRSRSPDLANTNLRSCGTLQRRGLHSASGGSKRATSRNHQCRNRTTHVLGQWRRVLGQWTRVASTA
jgi:hypothetical protein